MGFYEKQGFTTYGDYNYDEYMIHVPMILHGLLTPVPQFTLHSHQSPTPHLLTYLPQTQPTPNTFYFTIYLDQQFTGYLIF